MRTRLKNQINVLLDRLHIPLPFVTEIIGKRGTDYMRRLNRPAADGELLRENLPLLDVLTHVVNYCKGRKSDYRFLIQALPQAKGVAKRV
jgi:hypothetical protein